MGGGDGRMTGEGQFAHRGKNAGAIVRVTGRAKQEHGLGEVHLARDALHDLGGQVIGVEDHRRRIAQQGSVRKGIDLQHAFLHGR